MAISKEKVDGWLVGYAGKEYYKWDCYPLIISAKKFRVIPAVLLKLANSPEGWGMLDFELDFNECKCLKHLRWKSELNFEEIGFLQNAEPIPEFQDVMDKAIRQYLDYEKFSLEHWKAFCNSYKTIIEKIGFEEACKGVFVDEKDFPVNPLDLAEAPTPSLVRSDPDSVAPADTTPVESADNTSPKKKQRKKRVHLSPNLKTKIISYAARNPGATYKDLEERYNLSEEVFRRDKEKSLRKLVDQVRRGDPNRHAAKPDKPFNDEN
ncbi:MAG: hypothetical protein IJF17_14065 [Thermoguttaceae bacterium]|nr:hypothetical protein [Thermoguttaceae bacterium]